MPSEMLSVSFIVTIGGKTWVSAPKMGEPEEAISVEIEHRDNEATRLLLSLWDAVTDPQKEAFPEFNSMPNPRCNPNIPVEMWGGWDGVMVKMFDGILVGKRAFYQVSKTEFAALHRVFNLRKRGKVDTLKNITIRQMLIRKGAEEGINVIFDKSVAGDTALNTPASWFVQMGEPNWPLMYRYIREFGYVSIPQKGTDLLITADKSGGPRWLFKRGGPDIVNFELRYEAKRDERSPKVKGDAHRPPPGKLYHTKQGTDCGGGQQRKIHPGRVAKHHTRDREPFTKPRIKNYARRLAQEGDELTLSLRLQPSMLNNDVIVLEGFGGDIDGEWQTASIIHKLGGGSAKTEAACWRK